jgi:kinesin family protein C2/C3
MQLQTAGKQFELLRRATADELETLPANAKLWAEQASRAIVSSQDEVVRLRERLALESATRRKLLHEVQDLRGIVRVYCRPRPADPQSSPKSSSAAALGLVSIPSHETLLLHREKASYQDGNSSTRPMSFEFDRVLSSDMNQRDIYNELEEVCLGVLDGYNICIMAYGQTGSGKTHTLLGDVRQVEDTVTIENEGIQLQAARQLFYVADQRSERYKDVFTFSIVEVYNERLCDLIACTPFAEKSGKIVIEDAKLRRNMKKKQADSEGDASTSQPAGSVSSKPAKLEIWTNQNGDTVVHGLTAVEVTSLDDVRNVWGECIALRAARLAEQGVDVDEYEAASHVISTLKVVSTNVTTGIASVGKIQFVDLAGADLVKRKASISTKKPTNTAADGLLAGVGNNNDWKFANKSLATLSEVVNARCQFMRSVPYRNSTLTHLLRDSLEADTKVIMLVCVSSNPKDMQETACSLRFGARMRRVTIGKATKHTLNNA